MSMNGTMAVTKLGASAGAVVAITGEVSNSLDFAFDMIETTVKASAEKAKTYETGEYGGTLSCEAKVKVADGATIKALYDAAKAGTVQATEVSSGLAGDIKITGNALISGISLGNPQNDVRTVSYNLQFTGAIAAAVITT
jgi:hypothetical protein